MAYPVKPVRLIVPYPPGGGNDTLARLFGIKLTEAWGQQVVVDNRPGAGTIIGTQLAARAVPDGYTLLLSSIATHAIAPNKQLGSEGVGNTPEEFAKFVRAESAKYAKAIRDAGVKIE